MAARPEADINNLSAAKFNAVYCQWLSQFLPVKSFDDECIRPTACIDADKIVDTFIRIESLDLATGDSGIHWNNINNGIFAAQVIN